MASKGHFCRCGGGDGVVGVAPHGGAGAGRVAALERGREGGVAHACQMLGATEGGCASCAPAATAEQLPQLHASASRRERAAFQCRTLTQMPHPMHSSSEIHAILLFGATSMHSLPASGVGTGGHRMRLARQQGRWVWAGGGVRARIRPATMPQSRRAGAVHPPILTTGHIFLHSCRHFFGLHRSSLTMAIRVSVSSGSWRWGNGRHAGQVKPQCRAPPRIERHAGTAKPLSIKARQLAGA